MSGTTMALALVTSTLILLVMWVDRLAKRVRTLESKVAGLQQPL